jgi:hypothetical protein
MKQSHDKATVPKEANVSKPKHRCINAQKALPFMRSFLKERDPDLGVVDRGAQTTNPH